MKTFKVELGGESEIIHAKYMSVDYSGDLIFYNKSRKKLVHVIRVGYWQRAYEIKND